MQTKMYRYEERPWCPKCGSQALMDAVYCQGNGRWRFVFFMSWLPFRCKAGLDHLHYVCAVCKAWHMRACNDARERV